MPYELSKNYVREGLETRLEIVFNPPADCGYMEYMISCNDPSYLQGPHIRIEGGERIHAYPVTGYKTLDIIFRAHPIGADCLVGLLNNLFFAYEEIRELLLDPDDLVLDKELVFVSLEKGTGKFIYLPGYRCSLRKQMEELLEFILNRVDYDDKIAVELAYDCYVISMKEEQGIKAIKERVEKTELLICDKNVQEKKVESCVHIEKKKRVQEESKDENSFFGWLGKLLRKENGTEDNFSFETNEIQKDKITETVCLSSRRNMGMPYLLSEKTGEVVVLNKFPFYIGSLAGHTDYTINDETVSRLHAEILRMNEKYYLTDLFSTNGTFLGGKEVLPGKERELENDMKIRLASQEFVFKNGNSKV